MKLLPDMNISPDWLPTFTAADFEIVHWSQVGDVHATDTEIFSWAADNSFVVITYDLDFGELLSQVALHHP
jgi:predicted nuclease of predicted toxin-antitoxin system